MDSRITLTGTDFQKNRVALELSPDDRLSVGHGTGNRLRLIDPALADRQAVVECFDGRACLVDFGRNGQTFVNSKRIDKPTWLKHGDVVAFGSATKLTVRFADEASLPRASTKARPASRKARLSGTVFLSMVVLIAAATTTAALSFVVREPARRRTDAAAESPSAVVPAPTVEAATETTVPEAEIPDESDTLEKSAREALRGMSGDPVPYVFPSRVLEDLRKRVEATATDSTFAARVERLNASEQFRAVARQANVEPNWAASIALVETGDGAGRDVVQTAMNCVGALAPLKERYGTELADKSLILTACYRENRKAGRHGTFPSWFTSSKRDPRTEQNIWYFKQRGIIEADVYEFVLDVLAAAVVSRGPQGHETFGKAGSK